MHVYTHGLYHTRVCTRTCIHMCTHVFYYARICACLLYLCRDIINVCAYVMCVRTIDILSPREYIYSCARVASIGSPSNALPTRINLKQGLTEQSAESDFSTMGAFSHFKSFRAFQVGGIVGRHVFLRTTRNLAKSVNA